MAVHSWAKLVSVGIGWASVVRVRDDEVKEKWFRVGTPLDPVDESIEREAQEMDGIRSRLCRETHIDERAIVTDVNELLSTSFIIEIDVDVVTRMVASNDSTITHAHTIGVAIVIS